MHRNAVKTRVEGQHFGSVLRAGGMALLLLVGQTAPLLGNPTGGTVVAGSATIGPAGVTLSIKQSTQNAIINWQQFSIANGETTKFIVPNSGATLNRVTGGNPSAIYGNLQSNGTLYLVNPSGIVVGPSGRIDTAGFLASTLDVSNQQFLAGGNLEFAGSSVAAVENDGVIHASSGDVYLIANQVTNTGTVSAAQGTVGLAAGGDVLFQQAGTPHLFVQATPAGTRRARGVTNSGTIRAAAAELKAAGGNAYALAINNTGVIAATGFKKVNGQVYLTSDGGSISNSGRISAKQANGNGGKIVIDGTALASAVSGTVTNTGALDASATVAGGPGGTVAVKNAGGTTGFSGTILALGGQGGVGGSVDVSGGTLNFAGLVDVTAPGGTTGTLRLDPTTLDVTTGGVGTIVSGQNDSASTTIAPSVVVGALATANVILNADTSITISSALTWTSANTLTLSTNADTSGIVIAAPISGVNGGLTINVANSGGITATASVDVANFILAGGSWSQVSANLPAFTASNDFELQGSSNFVRIAGLDAANNDAEKITDIYGLQGLASPSGTQLGANVELANNIDASGTATWNGGAGFIPIGSDAGNFTGTFDGRGHAVNGLYINPSETDEVGLFGAVGGTVMNVAVTNLQIQGDASEVGGLAGENSGTISNSSTSGTITALSEVGGLVGYNPGTISGSSSSVAVTVSGGGDDVGGFVGFNTGTIASSSATGAVTTGAADGAGGLVGFTNGGSVTGSFSTGSVTAGADSFFVGGLEGDSIGGLTASYNTGSVVVGAGSEYVGGLEGGNGDLFYTEGGSVSNAYNNGSVMAGSGSSYVGGLVGYDNTATIDNTHNAGRVTAIASASVGALVGYNTGDSTVTNSYFTDTADDLPAIGTNFSTGVTTVTPPPGMTTQPTQPTQPTTAVTDMLPGDTLATVPQVVRNAVNATVPQTVETGVIVVPPQVAIAAATTPPISFSGAGVAEGLGPEEGGLADSSSSGAQVSSGDAVQLGGGLRSVANPSASGALNEALGPIVYQNLADALKDLGAWADVPDAAADAAGGGADGETILSGGDVVEMTDSSVKNIPLNQAPKQLQKAMNADVLKGAASGH